MVGGKRLNGFRIFSSILLAILMTSCFDATEGQPTTDFYGSYSSGQTFDFYETFPTDAPSTTVDRNDIIQTCCKAQGVSDTCQSFCTTDVSYLYSNLDKLVSCFNYLGDFLRCASGGQSYTSCCQLSGVSSDCLYMCSGTGQFNTTNMQAVTQCFETDSEFVLMCFNDGMPDPSTTVFDQSTIPSTSGNGSCLSNGCPANEQCQMMPGSCASTSTNCPFVPTCVAKPDLICQTLVNCSLTCPNGWATGAQGCPICECVATTTPTAATPCQPQCQGMLCLYGRIKDYNGCDMCNCFDPCQAANCAGLCSVLKNNMTQQYYADCYNPSSLLSTPPLTSNVGSTVSSSPCRPLPCPFCLYGYEMNMTTGCNTCQCHDPCENCTANQTCMKMQIDCPSSDASCDGSTFLGQCIDETPTAESSTASSTSSVSASTRHVCLLCMMYCPYGMLTDANGCAVCHCYDPCESLYCGGTQKCQIVQNACPSGISCDPRVQFTGECVDLGSTSAVLSSSTTGTPCPQLPCSDTMMTCQYGTAVDSNGCQTCQCAQPCLGLTCNATQICQPSSYMDCNGDECTERYKGTCQKAPYVCPSLLNCSLSCQYDLLKDGNGCSVCQCHDPCQNVTCSSGYKCQIRNDTVCTSTACSIQMNGYCAAICPPQPQPCSQMPCEYGFEKDSNGCDLCSCNNPCTNVTCQSGMYCIPDTTPMFTGDPPERVYFGQCVDCNTPTCSPSLVCQYGLARDQNGCRVCHCNDPCLNMTCPNGEKCIEPTSPTTVSNPDGSVTQEFVGQCVGKCFGPMCMIACMYGNVIGPDGCAICQCYDPCQNVTCPQMSKCVPQQQTTMSTAGAAPYVGQCIACPSSMCSTFCWYGTQVDSQGCSASCICNPDPCLNTTCVASGQVCQSVVFSPSCPGGGCSASTVCADETQPCTSLQQTYLTLFANDLSATPQLNCDVEGNFKPMQCFDSQCWCVDSNGKPISSKSSTVPQCYLNGQLNTNILKVDADINAIQPGDGWKYKQQISQQLANALQISDSMVTVVMFENGSIITQFVVGGSESTNSSVIKDRLDLLPNTMNVTYDGNDYTATLLGVAMTSTSASETPGIAGQSTPTTTTVLPTTDYTLLIILLCVFIPVGFLVTVISIVLICKVCRENRTKTQRFHEESRSSTEFDSLESNSDKRYRPAAYAFETSKSHSQTTDA